MLDEGPTDGSVGAAEKKFSINFSKAKTNFYESLHYNGDNSYLFVGGKHVNFSTQFLPGSLSKKFDVLNLQKYLLKEICMISQSVTMLLNNPTY